MYIGPKEVLLTLDAEFDRGASGDDIVTAVRNVEAEVRRQFPMIRRIYIEAGCLAASTRT